MKIYKSDPLFDYYENYGTRNELKQTSGEVSAQVYFQPSGQRVGGFEILSGDMNIPQRAFYSPSTISAEVTVIQSPGRILTFSLGLRDSVDSKPLIFGLIPSSLGTHKIIFRSDERRPISTIAGGVQMFIIAVRPSSTPLPVGGEMILSRLKLFVDHPPLADLAITSTREVGFHDTTQYLRTVTGKRVVGLPGYQYRTLEVELSRTPYDAFQSFIDGLYNHGVEKPLWLGFDKECHSEAFSPYDGFKCTLANLDEIMLQGGIRKDFYKTKLKFREVK